MRHFAILAQRGECYYCGKLSESMTNPQGDPYFCCKDHRIKYIAKSKAKQQMVKRTDQANNYPQYSKI